MTELEDKIKKTVNDIADKYRLTFDMEWFEFFPASKNNKECVDLVEKVAKQQNLELVKNPSSLKFGEDFGWFSQHFKSAIFGLGAGENQPALHHSNYDFPDELIASGIQMFKGLITEILGK